MRAAAISSVLVAGGGIVGWSAAAALKRRLPALAVTVVAVRPPADALADLIACTLPSIVEFHNDIGLSEADAVLRAGSGFRLGTRFENWAEGSADYVHAYGDCGRPFGTASFHQHWLRAAKAGAAAPFHRHSTAAEMAGAGRFVHPQGEPDSPLSGFGYGLTIDPPRYREMMQAYARHLGVAARPGGIAAVRLRGEDGFVEALTLEDGSELRADLFVDATGPAAAIRSVLDEEWEDWSQWLPCDRVLFAEGPPPPDPPALDRAVPVAAGWRWEAPSLVRTSHGLVYASQYLSDSKAERVLRNVAAVELREAAISLRQGRRPEPWLRNCVAIGDAAIVVEPLEWTNLHLAHNGIDRLIAMIPDRDCSAVELWDYNRQTAAEADRVRDFVVLHYALARRPSDPFWREASARALPSSLEHTLQQFLERGRLPFYEEETFSRDSWLAILLGQGALPRRTDPLIDVTPAAESDRTMAQMRDMIGAVVQTLPTHADYLRKLARQIGR